MHGLVQTSNTFADLSKRFSSTRHRGWCLKHWIDDADGHRGLPSFLPLPKKSWWIFSMKTVVKGPNSNFVPEKFGNDVRIWPVQLEDDEQVDEPVD